MARGSTSTLLNPGPTRATSSLRTPLRTRVLALPATLAVGLGFAILPPALSSAQCVSPSFVYPSTLPTPGLGPRDLVFADFDRDGFLDLATADSRDDTVTINWGKDLGQWEAVPTVVDLGVNTEPVALAVGDVNLNGTPDLVVALYGTQQLVPLLKSTTGRGFTVGNTVDANNAPLDVGLGDFDRDGDLDAVSAGETGVVQFTFNDGFGVFTNGVAPNPLPAGSPVNALGVADFDRDGYLDVALARGPTADVVLLLDNHAGGYAERAYPAPSGEPEDIALGDLDRDGAVDVVLAVQNANEVNVLLGDGSGGFSGSELWPVGGPQGGVALGDFTRDGILDVVASAGFAYVTGVGDGAGKFSPPDIWGGDPAHVAVGDIESDGDLDLGGVNPGGTLSLQLAVGSGSCPRASFARAGRMQVPLNGPSPYHPWAIASGDWDGDGFSDVAVVASTNVAVLMGDGTLRLAAPTGNALPFSSTIRSSLAVADFDLDSRPDLATVSPPSNALSVLLNTGGGTFAPAVSVPVGANPLGVVAGDFNGDGAPDLVSSDGGSSTLTFLPGRGDGTFGTPVTTSIALGGSIWSIAAGNVDGDPHLDVAVTYSGANVVRWFRGDGAGGFTLGGAVPTGTSPVSVDLGDLTGDGLADMAVANYSSDSVSVALNTGGAFAPPVTYPVSQSPRSVLIQPADGDTDADLLVTSQFGNEIAVFLNDGLGGFPARTVVQGLDGPWDAVVLDADGNGRRDLAVLNGNATGGVQILPGNGAGAFGPEQVSPGTGSRMLASADFDRDGKPDLATVDRNVSQIAFLKGGGDGTFAAPAPFAAGLSSPIGPGVGDFDRNGTLDLVLSSDLASSVSFLPGNGAGGFGPAVLTGVAGSGAGRRIVVGDFDRDGILDFARLQSLGTVRVLYGTGSGTFVAGPNQATGASESIDLVALDFNRDGILDLALSNSYSATITLLQGTGVRGSPWTVPPALVTGPRATGLATGDVDGDGITDLLVAHRDSDPATIGYFHGTGVGPAFFAARSDYDLGDPVLLQPDGVATADFDGDGRLDVLVGCLEPVVTLEGRATVRVLLGTGDPTPGLAFQAADDWVVAQESSSPIAIADFDRNGRPDFAIGNPFTTFSVDNRIAVVLNTNCLSRRLRLVQQPSRCSTAGSPFATQPKVQIEDDGANPIQCDAKDVVASIVPGTGTLGASLVGTTSLTPANGVSDWATTLPGLSIDTAGIKYRLGFQHADAGVTFSRTFSLPPPLAIAGPSAYCAAGAGLFSTDPGFDTYRWYVDSLGPAGFASSYTVPPAALAAGTHAIDVQATADTCPASASQPFDLVGDLTSVLVTPGATVSVCGNCTGPTLAVAETGGGALARRWGYRVTSGAGSPTWIPGQTGGSYALNGSDFPGQGTYYLVEETTPQCGIPTESNEVQVNVSTAAAAPDLVPAFTVRSTSGTNRLEWVFPAGLDKVAIRYRTSPDWSTCVPPPTPSDGFSDIADQAGTPGGKLAFSHVGLTDGLTYCYTIFAENPSGSGTYSLNGRSVKGRPFDTSGPVKWAFSMGTASLSAPGLGAGILHAVSNDDFLHAMVKAGATGAGAWPVAWKPYLGTGPSQSRPTNVPHSPPPSAVIYLGSQAAVGNNAVGVDADTGLGLWGQALGRPVQAGPAGIFTAYGGAIDAILVGTRQVAAPNAFHALDPFTLNPLPAPWPYLGDTSPFTNLIGIVSSQAAVDYEASRAYFTSYQYVPGSTDSVWCVDLITADRCTGWAAGVSASLGDVAASPTLRGSRVYVSPIVGVDGEIEALDASDGTKVWGGSFAPGDGQVKQFIVADLFSADLYFSTTNTVWAITDGGAVAGLKWSRADIPSPSQPVFFAGTGRVYVGGGDGRLYVLDAADGSTIGSPIALGDPSIAAGAPTVDQANGYVYLGSDAGVVFAVAIP